MRTRLLAWGLLVLASLSCSKTNPSIPTSSTASTSARRIGLESQARTPGWAVYAHPGLSYIPGEQDPLWFVRLNGTGARSLGLVGYDPAIRPRHAEFSFLRGDSVYLADTSGHASLFMATGHVNGQLLWRPNGEEFALSYSTGKWNVGFDVTDVYNARGQRLYTVSQAPQTFGADILYPGWVTQWPDESHFALLTARHPNAQVPDWAWFLGSEAGLFLSQCRTGTLTARIYGPGAGSIVGEVGPLSPDEQKIILYRADSDDNVILDLLTGVRTTLAPDLQAMGEARWVDNRTVIFAGVGIHPPLPPGLYLVSLDAPMVAIPVATGRIAPGNGFDVTREP